jgi:transposase-like protein
MQCPYCTSDRPRVTHTKRKGAGKRRRYRCGKCRRNFNTRVFEYVEHEFTPEELSDMENKARPRPSVSC